MRRAQSSCTGPGPLPSSLHRRPQQANSFVTREPARDTGGCVTLVTDTQTAVDSAFVLRALVGLTFAIVAGQWLLTRAITLRAQALTPAIARRLAWWVRTRDYAGDAFFAADGADATIVARRKAGLDRLSATCREHRDQSLAWNARVRDGLSDLRFTDANRVPFPFVRVMRERFDLCSVVVASHGPKLKNLDGDWTIDVSGSYGVNVAGFDRYKEWIHKGWERVKDLGPVLGPLHPIVADNITILKTVSNMDEVSFHMSGTEAVMASGGMARFKTSTKRIVCFSGAYHGSWDGG